jgi:hypothetical protein
MHDTNNSNILCVEIPSRHRRGIKPSTAVMRTFDEEILSDQNEIFKTKQSKKQKAYVNDSEITIRFLFNMFRLRTNPSLLYVSLFLRFSFYNVLKVIVLYSLRMQLQVGSKTSGLIVHVATVRYFFRI